jgi:hypothetical protein
MRTAIVYYGKLAAECIRQPNQWVEATGGNCRMISISHIPPAPRPCRYFLSTGNFQSLRLVVTWTFPADAAHEEKHSRVTFEIEPLGDAVRLTVTHDRLESDSEMLKDITKGRPKVLWSLKSLMEVGRPLPKLW